MMFEIFGVLGLPLILKYSFCLLPGGPNTFPVILLSVVTQQKLI